MTRGISNLQENEMKNMEDDLKNSIQNLTGAISIYDSEINRRLNDDFDEQEMEKLYNKKIDLEQEKAWEERFLELVQRLDRIEKKIGDGGVLIIPRKDDKPVKFQMQDCEFRDGQIVMKLPNTMIIEEDEMVEDNRI